MSDISACIVELSAEVGAIVQAARRTIRSVRPDATETSCGMRRPRSPSMMWKLARYGLDGETVVTIGAFTRHGSIYFARGAELSDPDHVLEGTGKVLRYVTLRSPKDVTRSAVRALLREAFGLVAPAKTRARAASARTPASTRAAAPKRRSKLTAAPATRSKGERGKIRRR